MTTITINKPADVRMPRAAPVLASLFVWLTQLGGRTLSKKAAKDNESSRVAEAAAVRRYAESVSKDDPRFAADLYAAADRHELLG